MVENNLDIQKVIDLIKSKDFEKALRLANALLKKNQKNEVLTNIVAIIYRRMGLFERAEYWANRAIALKSDFWAAINNKANIFHEKGEIGPALDLFRTLLDKNPNLHR